MSDKELTDIDKSKVNNVTSVKTFDSVLTNKEKEQMVLPEECNIFDFNTGRITHYPTLIQKRTEDGLAVDDDINEIVDLLNDFPEEQLSLIIDYNLEPSDWGFPEDILDE